MKKLLVIVDMVNGFINEGALSDKKINKITPVIVDLTKKAILKKIPIIAFKDTHVENDIEFETYPPHCIKGTTECELIPELQRFKKSFISIEKDTTNGFNTPEFQKIINHVNFEEIIIVGCCTDICVENFALSLINFNKKNGRKSKVTVLENAVYTFDSKMHPAQLSHKNALEKMKNNGVIIKTHKLQNKKEF